MGLKVYFYQWQRSEILLLGKLGILYSIDDQQENMLNVNWLTLHIYLPQCKKVESYKNYKLDAGVQTKLNEWDNEK